MPHTALKEATPVFASQAAFRAVMDAMARPGTIHPLPPLAHGPARFNPQLATLAQTLCDHDSVVLVLPAADAELLAWLAFATGAPHAATSDEAAFVLIEDASHMPPLDRFALGTDEYPDRSATIVLAVPALDGGTEMLIQGPGIDGRAAFSPLGLPEGFVAAWQVNREKFPRGVDLVLVAPGAVAALPRTTRIVTGG